MRRILVLAVAAGMMALTPVASAAPPGESGVVVRGEVDGGFIYWGDGTLAITGNALEEPCLNLPPPFVSGSFISPGDGSSQDHRLGEVPVLVFQDPRLQADDLNIGFFFIFEEQCGLLLDGDPNTNPVDPVATGDVLLRADFRVDTRGVVHSHNSLVGQVTTSDGDKAHLNTFAQLTIDAATGALINVQQLRVHYTG